MVEVDSGVVVVVVVIIAEVVEAVVVARTNTQKHIDIMTCINYACTGIWGSRTFEKGGVYVRIWCFSQPANWFYYLFVLVLKLQTSTHFGISYCIGSST